MRYENLTELRVGNNRLDVKVDVSLRERKLYLLVYISRIIHLLFQRTGGAPETLLTYGYS